MSGENYSSCSQVFLIFEQLIKHLEECLNNKKFESLKDTIKCMSDKLNEYWPLIKDTAHICMILDPCFKIFFLHQKEKRPMELNLLKKLFHQYSGTIQDTNNTCEPSLQINGKYFLRL